MKKYYPVCWFILCILAASCSSSTSAPVKTSHTPIIPQSPPPSSYDSLSSYWEMVDQPIPADNGSAIIVYALKLTGHNTVLISSVLGGEEELNLSNLKILLRDNLGDADLLSTNTLASPENVRFMVMEFGPRSIAASEIALLVAQSNGVANTINQIARFVGPPVDPIVFSRRTYLISANQTFEQNGYRIFFEGWGPPPPPVTPSTVEPYGDVMVIDKATLRIENLSTGKKDYLYIQFLSNGETESELIQ